MPVARIGLGANLGSAASRVEEAIAALGTIGTVKARSKLYRCEPWGVTSQPPFINAAALLETSLTPRELLSAVKRLEVELGRIETFRWGPRTIDIDILAYDELEVHEPDLVIPHERLHERAFALVPLAEIDPSYEEARAQLSAAQLAEVELLR
jgi:2-amino-4-hydroxy-6-hydroxymethyldihydropteridine diphosphokinase